MGFILCVLINGVFLDLEVFLVWELIFIDDFFYDFVFFDFFVIKDIIFSVFDGFDVFKLVICFLDVMYLFLKIFLDSFFNIFKVIENSCGSFYYINLEFLWFSLYVRFIFFSFFKLFDMFIFMIEGCFIFFVIFGWLWGIVFWIIYYRDNSIGCGLYYNVDIKEI